MESRSKMSRELLTVSKRANLKARAETGAQAKMQYKIACTSLDTCSHLRPEVRSDQNRCTRQLKIKWRSEAISLMLFEFQEQSEIQKNGRRTVDKKLTRPPYTLPARPVRPAPCSRWQCCLLVRECPRDGKICPQRACRQSQRRYRYQSSSKSTQST